MAALELARVLELTREHAARRDELVRLERRRRAMLRRLAGPGGEEPTLAQLADRHPPRAKVLRRLREELVRATDDVGRRGKLAAGVAGGVLGHVNTALRLLGEAAGRDGRYTAHGTAAVGRGRSVVEALI